MRKQELVLKKYDKKLNTPIRTWKDLLWLAFFYGWFSNWKVENGLKIERKNEILEI